MRFLEEGIIEMPLQANRPAHEIAVCVQLPDLSTESVAYAVAPIRGRIVRAYSVIENAITAADAEWTVRVNGSAVADAVTVTQSGSAAGNIDEASLNAVGGSNYVSAGASIEFSSNGGSSTTCPTNFVAVIRPGG
jgi:hypothetical protein